MRGAFCLYENFNNDRFSARGLGRIILFRSRQKNGDSHPEFAHPSPTTNARIATYYYRLRSQPFTTLFITHYQRSDTIQAKNHVGTRMDDE